MSITMPVRSAPSESRRPQEKKLRKDILILAQFVQCRCRARHCGREAVPVAAKGTTLSPWISDLNLNLCSECRSLFLHGAAKRVLCPYDPKPRCKKCPTPCYRPGYRETVRAVMRDSGLRMILRGRVDLLYKYFF